MKHTKMLLTFDKPELTEMEQNQLFLMPLVQIAWAHGAIAPRERQIIFKAAREDSFDERESFNDTLANLLQYQPSREFFNECLSIIREKLAEMTVKERKEIHQKILRRCREVAASAGGNSPMDLNHHISDEEQILLNEIEDLLK